MDANSWSDFQEAVTHYRKCKAEFDAQEKEAIHRGVIREHIPEWKTARIALETAREHLFVTGLEAYCRALERKSEADARLVERQLELADRTALGTKETARWTKWLVIATTSLIVVSALVGVLGILRPTPPQVVPIRLEYPLAPSTPVRPPAVVPESVTRDSADGP
jgi:hypothetical protein